jgi:hypothetical protein
MNHFIFRPFLLEEKGPGDEVSSSTSPCPLLKERVLPFSLRRRGAGDEVSINTTKVVLTCSLF